MRLNRSIAVMAATSSMAQMALGEPETIVVPTEPAVPRTSLEAALFPLMAFLALLILASQGDESGSQEMPD